MQQAPQNLSQLRKARGLSKIAAASALRLSTDVWNAFEEGTILLETLSQACLHEMATYLEVSKEELWQLLANSDPAPVSVCQKKGASTVPVPQSFIVAVTRSTMSREDKGFWRRLLDAETGTIRGTHPSLCSLFR